MQTGQNEAHNEQLHLLKWMEQQSNLPIIIPCQIILKLFENKGIHLLKIFIVHPAWDFASIKKK